MNIKKQAISGVKWTTISTVILAASSLIKISVLARFLDPSDFGLMALVSFVLGFTDLFMDMGLSSAILHRQNITRKEYSSLYWLNVSFSAILLFIIAFVISPVFAAFYLEPELLKLIPLAGIGIILSAIGRQYKTIFQKKLEFKRIAIVDIFSAVIALVFAIIFAINGFGVYALVYSALIQYGLSNLIYFLIGNKQQSLLFHFNFNETKPFLKIGIYQVGGQVVNYFNRDLDVLIIGKFFGAELLGGYSLAKQLVYRPAQVLNPIFTRVASPILAKLQNDVYALKQHYLKLVNIIVSVNAPIYVSIIILAPTVVTLLYGQGFQDITILVRVLSIYMIFRAVCNPVGTLVVATGRTDLEFYWNLLTLFFMPISIIVGAQFSLVAVTCSITVAMILLLVPNWFFLIRKLTKATLREYLKSLTPSF
jgi:O-antigen/teichoic acid export membrane protein